MVDFKKPKPITRKELEAFLPTPRAVRAFEQLFDLIPTDLLTINKYLMNSITDVIDDVEITDSVDTLKVNTTTKDITVTLIDILLDGKVINIKHFEGSNHCYVVGNIDGVVGDTFELFLGESITVQFDIEDSDWCIV